MILIVLRALFVLVMAAIGWAYVRELDAFWGEHAWLVMVLALVISVLIVCVDILAPRRKLVIFSGTFLGLVVGISIAYALSFVVQLLVEQFVEEGVAYRDRLQAFITLLVGVVTCYLAISFILQTKDDFRFVIPYVEFAKQSKGARPVLLDTSALIDGRIADIARCGILDSQLVVPRFVLQEMQSIADSADRLKRNRGRRGLDVLADLQKNPRLEVRLYDSNGDDGAPTVDEKLMNLAQELDARVLTTDFNLNKVAQLRGVEVININDLANAVKPIVLPGERMTVRMIKAGEEPGQGIGYLADGTMVVVEQGRHHLNEDVEFVVTSALQTSAGKMIFGRIADGPAQNRRPRPRTDTPSSAQ
jgi:uncharacterized protein YacL